MYFLKKEICGIIFFVVIPNPATEGGVGVGYIASFLVSVIAGIVAYYICKWLDRDNNDN